jgi:hypothetical protein
MKLAEFEARKEEIRCRVCGNAVLETYRPDNGNHVGARCPACGCKDPISPGIWWLSQDGSAESIKRKRHSEHDVRETWRRWGDHCSLCGKPWDLCVRLKIGRTVQHVHPIMFDGAEDGPVIPFCARCQEMSRPLQLETRDVLNALLELDRR